MIRKKKKQFENYQIPREMNTVDNSPSPIWSVQLHAFFLKLVTKTLIR